MHVFVRFLKVDKGHFFFEKLGALTNFENIYVFRRLLKVDKGHVFLKIYDLLRALRICMFSNDF